MFQIQIFHCNEPKPFERLKWLLRLPLKTRFHNTARVDGVIEQYTQTVPFSRRRLSS